MKLFEQRELNLLQVINITLALGVFTVLADHLGKTFNDTAEGTSGPVPIALTVLLVVWTLKLFIDDHTHFAEHARRRFYAVVSLFFCVGGFLTLTAAASQLENFNEATNWLRIHFCVLLAWVITSIGIRIAAGEEDDPPDKGMAMRFVWLAANLLYIILVCIIRDMGPGEAALIPIALMVVGILVDSILSDTFGLAKSGHG